MEEQEKIQGRPGVLITSDEATIVYILWLNQKERKPFIERHLDARNVFVNAAAVPYIKERLRFRDAQNTFDEDEQAGQPVMAGATA